jgi:hypothetical protein
MEEFKNHKLDALAALGRWRNCSHLTVLILLSVSFTPYYNNTKPQRSFVLMIVNGFEAIQ